MMAVKGMLLKKLKTMKPMRHLKPERFLLVNASDGYSHASVEKFAEDPDNQEPEIIDVAELMRDLDDPESDDKENVMPPGTNKSNPLVGDRKKHSPFRPTELNSKTLKSRKVTDPLIGFEERCPPGGGDSVVLYTTSLRGIRKTFEDCKKMRSILENLKVLFLERDMSMHSEFREELWRISEEKLLPPRLFVKGRYIGGIEEVLRLHERGELKVLLEGMPVDRNEGPCEGCGGIRFVVCFRCNGSRRNVIEGGGDCEGCNENGVIICPFCC